MLFQLTQFEILAVLLLINIIVSSVGAIVRILSYFSSTKATNSMLNAYTDMIKKMNDEL